MAQKKKASKKTKKEQASDCPIYSLSACFREITDKNSPAFDHLNKSWIEFLEGVRYLVDERIKAAKKRGKAKKSKLSKIKVED
jgi:hypothetical protein